jgi:hypothetical protein
VWKSGIGSTPLAASGTILVLQMLSRDINIKRTSGQKDINNFICQRNYSNTIQLPGMTVTGTLRELLLLS